MGMVDGGRPRVTNEWEHRYIANFVQRNRKLNVPAVRTLFRRTYGRLISAFYNTTTTADVNLRSGRPLKVPRLTRQYLRFKSTYTAIYCSGKTSFFQTSSGLVWRVSARRLKGLKCFGVVLCTVEGLHQCVIGAWSVRDRCVIVCDWCVIMRNGRMIV